jgi:large subunit ribosomal protein L29
MKPQDIREKTLEELKRELHEQLEELFRYRFQATLGKLDNKVVIRNTRRNIARLKTIINEKQHQNG